MFPQPKEISHVTAVGIRNQGRGQKTSTTIAVLSLQFKCRFAIPNVSLLYVRNLRNTIYGIAN